MIAYKTRENWKYIYRVVAVLPMVYSVVVVPFVCESPRWLAIKGRRREAMEVLVRLARINGRKLPANLAIYDAGTTFTLFFF